LFPSVKFNAAKILEKTGFTKKGVPQRFTKKKKHKNFNQAKKENTDFTDLHK
jgi:hypothetical protein